MTVAETTVSAMWSNPRVPFALSRDRPKLAPFRGKPIMVNLAMNIQYWPFDRAMPRGVQIGRAHVRTPVTNAHLVCRLLLQKKKKRHSDRPSRQYSSAFRRADT